MYTQVLVCSKVMILPPLPPAHRPCPPGVLHPRTGTSTLLLYTRSSLWPGARWHAGSLCWLGSHPDFRDCWLQMGLVSIALMLVARGPEQLGPGVSHVEAVQPGLLGRGVAAWLSWPRQKDDERKGSFREAECEQGLCVGRAAAWSHLDHRWWSWHLLHHRTQRDSSQASKMALRASPQAGGGPPLSCLMCLGGLGGRTQTLAVVPSCTGHDSGPEKEPKHQGLNAHLHTLGSSSSCRERKGYFALQRFYT